MENQNGSFLHQFLIRIGIAKDEIQAQNILIIVIFLCLCITGFFIYRMNRSVPTSLTPEQMNMVLKNVPR